MSMSSDDDQSRERSRAETRLQILDEVLRAIDMMGDIGEAVRSSEDRTAAMRTLADAPFGFTEVGVQFVMDLVLGRQTIEGRNHLQQEADDVRRLLDGSTPSSPRPPASPRLVGVAFDPGSPAQFERLVVGPGVEVDFAPGKVRVIAVELYESRMIVQWRHVQDPDQAVLPSFGSPPRVSDDLGNDYGCLAPDVPGSTAQGEHFGRVTCVSAPIGGASRLNVSWGHKTIEVPLQ